MGVFGWNFLVGYTAARYPFVWLLGLLMVVGALMGSGPSHIQPNLDDGAWQGQRDLVWSTRACPLAGPVTAMVKDHHLTLPVGGASMRVLERPTRTVDGWGANHRLVGAWTGAMFAGTEYAPGCTYRVQLHR